ncbi:uncharacterized protein LOC114882477 [Osmia bicornis bicornis]|uniref:uncharacterized protein LOC114882477 n=1 Tax=Osmia bicornis bicornis TaxID=1437191 RepID=UPI001EAF6499|nr:uncharacterized protein LOC114882477 [Osmia bicornis bicornis]
MVDNPSTRNHENPSRQIAHHPGSISGTAMSAFTVLQASLNHCRAAQDILWQAVHDFRADIVVISEPYSPRPEWYTDPSGTLSIWHVQRPPPAAELGAIQWNIQCSPPSMEEWASIITANLALQPETPARIRDQTIFRFENRTDIDNAVSELEVLEEPSQDTAPFLTPDGQECEDHFKTTHSRDSAGRYIVRLPLKLHLGAVGNSYQTAHNCLQRILRRLSKDAQYIHQYTKFMLEYEQLGHMVRLNNDSIISPFQYFLPHHGVLKLGSTTTTLRVVFNGSSPASSGYSLNDLLHTGPNLMLNIADLLI